MSNIEYCIRKASELPFIKGQKRMWCIALSKQGKIISECSNSYVKTSPKQAFYAKRVGLDSKVFLHSEIRAICLAKGKKIHKLIIARVDSQNNPVLAKPCPICSLMIDECGIKLIEHTDRS